MAKDQLHTALSEALKVEKTQNLIFSYVADSYLIILVFCVYECFTLNRRLFFGCTLTCVINKAYLYCKVILLYFFSFLTVLVMRLKQQGLQ